MLLVWLIAIAVISNIRADLPSCPSANSSEDVYLPDESDCSKFYKCSNGVAIEMECPDLLYFSRSRKICDWPYLSDCSTTTTTTTSKQTTSSTPSATTTSPSTPSPTTTSPATPSPTRVPSTITTTSTRTTSASTEIPTQPPINTVCPDDTDGETIFLPVEGDCTKFSECCDGATKVHKCPNGLIYNAQLEFCDEPENTECPFSPTNTKDRHLPFAKNRRPAYLD